MPKNNIDNNLKIIRRYKEFDELNAILQRRFEKKNYNLPYLPSKFIANTKTSIEIR